MIPYKKKVIVLSIVSGVLLTSFVIGLLVKNGRSQTGVGIDLIENIEADDIASVSISGQGKQVKLSTNGSEWLVDLDGVMYPARAARIDSFLNDLSGLSTLRQVSNSSTAFADLKIDEDQAYIVSVGINGSTRTLLFGDLGVQGNEQFVRLEGSETVYAVQGGIRFSLEQKASYWAEKRVWPTNLDDTKIVRVIYREIGHPQIVVTKTEKDGQVEWNADTLPDIDPNSLATWIRGIQSLEGDEIIFVDPESGISPEYTMAGSLTLRTTDDVDHVITVYKGIDASAENLFLLPQSTSERQYGDKTVAFMVPAWKLNAELFDN